MKKVILVVLFLAALVLVINATIFVMAISRGGSSADTKLELASPPTETARLQFDQYLRNEVGALCTKPSPVDVCQRWTVDEVIWVRAQERKGVYKVFLDSMPRYVLFFGPPRFTRTHKRVENRILDFWRAEVVSVEHKLR